MSAAIPTRLGTEVSEILTELHQLIFRPSPDCPLSVLEREYVAFVLACYYQCDHCRDYHERAILSARKKEQSPAWEWERELVKATLFLRISKNDVSPTEWEEWRHHSWANFAKRVDNHHSGLAHYLAFAVGIARNDVPLMELAFEKIVEDADDLDRAKRLIISIDRVVIYMKAATSKNRTDQTIKRMLKR